MYSKFDTLTLGDREQGFNWSSQPSPQVSPFAFATSDGGFMRYFRGFQDVRNVSASSYMVGDKEHVLTIKGTRSPNSYLYHIVHTLIRDRRPRQ